MRSGYVTDSVNNLNENVTRREIIRWCIQSFGLEFEAKIFNDMPMTFKDAKNLSIVERGCLFVASHMNPPIVAQADFFRGHDGLTVNEMNAILERVRNASKNFNLDVVRHPLEGLELFIHREGVPTGIPSWRVSAGGIRTKAAAESIKNFFKAHGINASISGSGDFSIRTGKIDNFNIVRNLRDMLINRGISYKIMPSISNLNTSIVPKYWVMLVIDPTFWNIRPISSPEGPRTLDVLSKIAKSNYSLTAINAGFFAVTTAGRGYPIGALRINNTDFNFALNGRGCLGWNDNGEAKFGIPSRDLIENSWDDMNYIIQGGPLILNDGKISEVDEKFNSAFTSTRHPRSVIGLTDDGRWVFLIFDGRNGLHSSGATISELADVMKAAGISNALNLDGGGSTEIMVNGKFYNMPSDGYERKISYGIGAIKIK